MPAAPPTVLLVEDNPTDVFVIREVLAECGLKLSLEIASNGQDALTFLRNVAGDELSRCPALVLLDLNVPKVTGFEILRELRSGAKCNQIPVIIVTSSGAEADRTAAQRLGADAYFQKPSDLTAYLKLGQLVKSMVRHNTPGGEA